MGSSRAFGKRRLILAYFWMFTLVFLIGYCFARPKKIPLVWHGPDHCEVIHSKVGELLMCKRLVR